jgi:hypothetical protein
MTNGFFSDEYAAAVQIERELETEDLVLLSQLRKAQRPGKEHVALTRPTRPYVARPSLSRPGAQIAEGR